MRALTTGWIFNRMGLLVTWRGGRKHPSLELAVKIADLFGVSLDQLARDEARGVDRDDGDVIIAIAEGDRIRPLRHDINDDDVLLAANHWNHSDRRGRMRYALRHDIDVETL